MSIPAYEPFNEFIRGTRLLWQPVVDLENGRTVGAEALLRPRPESRPRC